MRREPDFFGETALELEHLLTGYSIEYLVEPDTYRGGLLFASERVGAFFYVAPESHETAKEVLVKNNYEPYEIK